MWDKKENTSSHNKPKKMFEVVGRQREDERQRERDGRGKGVEYKRTVPCGFS